MGNTLPMHRAPFVAPHLDVFANNNDNDNTPYLRSGAAAT